MTMSQRSRQRATSIAAKTPAAALNDRLLISLGCDPHLISDLLGDLREEYADRSARHGDLAARFWYAREILRSAPHLLWSAVHRATPAARVRVAAYALAGIGTLSVLTIAWVTRKGPPARLVATQDYSEGIVVNNIRPVQLSMGVVDAAGRPLKGADIRYRRVSGSPIEISAHGAVRCGQRGDALVRASLGNLNKDFVVHCEPIKEIREAGWGNFVIGQHARTLSVDAIGLDKAPVTRIAARLRVDDSTIATLDGSALRPLRPGSTRVDIDIGDQTLSMLVTVFERVTTFEGLTPGQRWVVAPVHLTRGESLRWPLPVGDFFMGFGSDSTESLTPRGFGSIRIVPSSFKMSVDGPIMCMPDLQRGVQNTHCLARGPGATLTITHPGRNAPHDMVGLIALELSEHR